MRLKNELFSVLFAMIFTGLIVVMDGLAAEPKPPFPSYGSGSVEVRIYSDYFCSPCRAMEPAANPILKDLLKKKVIRLVLVDTPFHPYTPLYARYFLYAFKANSDMDHAFRVRNILFEASTDKSITTKERIEALFKEKWIPYAVFNEKSVFDSYIGLLKEDNINRTPTCVIIKNGQKITCIGEADIVSVLKSLQ